MVVVCEIWEITNQKTPTEIPTNSSLPVYSSSDDEEVDYETRPEFYDSEVDDKDELWVATKRKSSSKSSTDAVLSCPACFTTLCHDCQRHEIYVTQYRAMFVVNCQITDAKTLVPQGGGGGGKRKKRKDDEDRSSSSEEVVRRVCCSICSTEVGVIGNDEVYHFHHVIPSE